MPNLHVVSVEEYLNTPYDPDVEYVDGMLVERKSGEWLHSLVQSNMLFALRRKYPRLKVLGLRRGSIGIFFLLQRRGLRRMSAELTSPSLGRA